MSFKPGRVRAQVNVAKGGTWIDQQTGESPSVPRGFALDVEAGFFTNTTDADSMETMDFSGFLSVTFEVHDNQYRLRPAVCTIQGQDFNEALSSADWIAQNGYHCRALFSEQDMFLDLGGTDSKTFWLYIYGIDASGKRRNLGGTTLRVYETGASVAGSSGPNQGANLVPGGAVYDGSGNYSLAAQIDKLYEWTKSTNDTSIVNGTGTYTTSQQFRSQGSSVTLKGTAGQAVTAILRYPIFWSADETQAAIDRQSKATKAFDDYINGKWKRTVGIDANGVRIDQVEQL